jgi:hypothetical protein
LKARISAATSRRRRFDSPYCFLNFHTLVTPLKAQLPCL